MQKSKDSISSNELDFIINHVFLPPKLPHEADDEDTLANMNLALLSLLHESAIEYQHGLVGESSEQWATVIKMLSNLCKLQGRSNLCESDLSTAIGQMHPGDVLTLHIAAQNAGIVLHHLETEMLFLSFEASPTTAAVMGNSGKLLCSYPGPAIAVPLSKAKDPTFRKEFSIFAEQMNRTVLQDALPVSKKAGTEVPEERDSAHPKFVTEMLTGILRAIGRPAEFNRFQKRIADEICWNNAKLPWRRSPLWLVIRVALQITLKNSLEYKSFMVFFLADILEIALKKELDSDMLFIMNTKLSRRVYKIDIPQFVLRKATGVTTANNQCLNDRWTQIQEHNSKSLDWAPGELSFKADSHLSLSNSRQYLAAVIERKPTNLERFEFKASHPPRNQITGASEKLPTRTLVDGSEDEIYTLLADFEAWVQENLDLWVEGNIHREVASRELSEWIDDYSKTAKSTYLYNPENMSIMLLTTYELWVAMDKVVVNHYPLLLEYSPGLLGSDKLFEPLLLPRYQQMERLHRVEAYLEQRRIRASSWNTSIFSSSLDSSCFAVRYFEKSATHKQLEQKIQGEAEREKQRKIEEFHRKRAEYDNLISSARAQSCTRYQDYRGRRRHPYCEKCNNKNKADRMRIEVHEWPLPEDRIQRMGVIFELECPLEFSIWRDTTYKILVDICTPVQSCDQGSEPFEQLWKYNGLSQHYQSKGQRLAWSSKTKSFLRSHYSDRSFPTSVDTICVDNALKYRLFDTGTSKWTKHCLGRFNVRKFCTFPLPEGPYRVLQYAVDGTSHTSNKIIANQEDCPVELSLHEYDSFCTLRAGHRLQWLNIARELRANTLTFSDEAVNILLMQAGWQAGPSDSSTIYRESHIDLERFEFGETLLGELERMLTSIEANWLESISAKILIHLTARLLSTNKHDSITRGALSLLRRSRDVTLNWTRQLAKKLQDCEVKDIKDLQLRALQMAAICRATYDVDDLDNHLGGLLNSAEDIATLIKCATIVHDNTPANTGNLSQSVCHLLDRDRRLSYTIERYLKRQVFRQFIGEGLNKSILQAYNVLGSSWDSLPEPKDRWMMAKGDGSNEQKLYFNLLSGQFLVDGSPVGRMPSDFVSHATYQRLFHEKILDVLPSDMPGMRYKTQHKISRYQVHFTMLGQELVIRACGPENADVTDVADAADVANVADVYEFIPHTKLSGDFPRHLVDDYAHWLNVGSKTIEFRPINHPWKTSPKNWNVSYSQAGSSFMYRGEERMLDIRSRTVLMISSLLKSIEAPECIDIRSRHKDGSELVSVYLPRLKLEFFINENKELECRQFRGAIVDRNRNIGTLSGLVNRLVLCQNDVRTIIIPYGTVNYGSRGSHVMVHIDPESLTKGVRYYSYTVDSRLGRLVGNGSLASHLYKIYLHAVTAHCLPDPLTSRTGTEEALDNLRSAATWSFQGLQPDEVEILRLIASLTPTRVYYPDHLKVMQTVHWRRISPIMQHDEFNAIVMEIFAHATKFHAFWEESKPKDAQPTAYYKSKSNPKLLRRAAIRNAAYCKDEFGGSILAVAEDTLYLARDLQTNGSKEMQVFSVAKAVGCWRPDIDITQQLMGVLEKWKDLKGAHGENIRLGYDHRWVEPDLAAVWGSIYDACRRCERDRNAYQMMFFLSTLAYSGRVELSVVGSLLAFATIPQFRSQTPPQYPSYNLADKYAPNGTQLKGSIDSCSTCFESSQEANLSARSGESEAELWRRQNATYRENLEHQSESFVANLISQWPCASPTAPYNMDYRLLDSSEAMDEVKPKFDSWYRNKALREHITDVQSVLNSIHPARLTIQEYVFQPCTADGHRIKGRIALENLLRRDAPSTPKPSATYISVATVPTSARRNVTARSNDLKLLLNNFKKTHFKEFEKVYANNMLASLKALEKEALSADISLESLSKSLLKSILARRKSHLQDVFLLIQNMLAPVGDVENLMDMAGLWPCISPVSLLQQLSAGASEKLSIPWRRALVSYGKAITQLQRLERLLACHTAEREREFHGEAQNIGHQDWDPMDHPDWLLIEIENNILVRRVQNQIASEMIQPSSGGNQTLQLNMGEGKSSVIVPIVAAALADGKKLVRVVVLKPLAPQMFRLLVQKLSGLANRRIFYMPFSRLVELDQEKATHIRHLYEECARVRGILLVQPEHILSFKLIGLEYLHKKDNELAKPLLDAQRWLEANTQDILDECDELLHTRNELIYTIGGQQSFEGSPDRWMIVQEIFNLVKRHVVMVGKEFPQGLEVETGKGVEKKIGCFPVVRILEPEAGRELLHRVASDIIKGLLPTVSFRLFPSDIRQLALDFIAETNVSPEHIQPLLDYCGNDTPMTFLLLLRGLISENILFFALKEKRWRVDYGLAPDRIPRTSLAVPFRAKDVPAPRAEFSHPDVMITLTCLSYYYTGLSDSQLEDCFKILLKLSNPVVEYEGWIQGLENAVPETLRKLSGINLKDNDERINTIFPLFRFNKSVIDFYLSNAIFPKEAKEFRCKLTSSGWDIAQSKTYPTTGFSGTNDSRDLLPLTVKQHERQEQLSTNAKVLSYLLQRENSYVCAKDASGGRLDVDGLLEMLVSQDPPIQVLLDVGAQVLECENEEVARRWLSRVPESKAQAVVFFDQDELTVRTRDGSREPYGISVFAKQMDQCLVYLDEVHTRGTDLKLPRTSRAAVTLGPNLTKDRLVQACMRMRMLGHGQSVLFCAPPEIEREIERKVPHHLTSKGQWLRDFDTWLGDCATVAKSLSFSLCRRDNTVLSAKPRSSSASNHVQVSDVLHWSMVEACISNRNNIPIWAKQGISYQRRHLAYQDIQSSDVFPSLLREEEAKTLDERFGVRESSEDVLFGPIPLELEKKEKEMGEIRKMCALFDVESLHGAHAQEEQERELSYEIEREQQVQRPPRKEPLAHHIHPDVVELVEQGAIKSNSAGFVSAFKSLLQTSAGNDYENSWSPSLYATNDFIETVKKASDSPAGEFLRPVHWVLSTNTGNQLVIMSPYEVNELIPRIRRSRSVNLHIYSPKVTKGMRSFLEDWSSWAIISPPLYPLSGSLFDELNIFAGQLYLTNYKAYEEICGFLGLYLGELPADKDVKIHSDGFVEDGSRGDLGMEIHSPFSKSPVIFLGKLMEFRRKGQDYLATHLGQILHGRLLTEQDFETA